MDSPVVIKVLETVNHLPHYDGWLPHVHVTILELDFKNRNQKNCSLFVLVKKLTPTSMIVPFGRFLRFQIFLELFSYSNMANCSNFSHTCTVKKLNTYFHILFILPSLTKHASHTTWLKGALLSL